MVWDKITSNATQMPATDLSDTSSISSLDTASISSSSETLSPPTFYKNLKNAKDLPGPFEIPKFSLDVELRLKKANDIYKQTKTPFDTPKDMISAICGMVVQSIF